MMYLHWRSSNRGRLGDRPVEVPPQRSARLPSAACAAAISAVLALALAPRIARAQERCLPREQDEVWQVSTRNVGCPVPEQGAGFDVRRFDPQQGWLPEALDELLRPQTDQKLIIFVHGNRMSSRAAVCQGWHVYHALTDRLDNVRPIRFLIWSWPSSQMHGPLRDVRSKAHRTEVDGYCLGAFLSRLSPGQQVGLLGYSFGARIVTGAVHLAGGGQLSGRLLPEESPERSPVRVVLIAAALHNYWLRPGAYHGSALDRMDKLVIFHNHCDPVLRRYHVLDKCGRNKALGYTGMFAGDLGPVADRIEQPDVSRIVGRSHDIARYLGSPQLRKRMRDCLFWHTGSE